MIELIACDLDGTLLDSDHNLTEDNIKVIEELKAKSLPFVIATGRIYPSAAEFSRKLGLKDPIVACNGAVVKDPVKDEIIFHYPVPKTTMLALVDICKKHDIYFHIYGMDTVYAERDERLIKKYREWALTDPSKNMVKTAVVEDIKPIIEEHVLYKMGIYVDEEGAQDAYDEMVKVDGLTSCFSLSTLVDIFNVEASKGNAIRDLGKLYNISTENIMSLGDNENDISMLEQAGLGIAMADAKDNVKAAANEVTISNDESGVASAIRKHVSFD